MLVSEVLTPKMKGRVIGREKGTIYDLGLLRMVNFIVKMVM